MWRNNLKTEDISLNGNKILDKLIQNQGKGFAVTGYTFNSQDLNQKIVIGSPIFSSQRDPRMVTQNKGAEACLAYKLNQENQFLDVATAPANSPTSEARGIIDIFVRTTPHQIVRQRANPQATARLATSPELHSPRCSLNTPSPDPVFGDAPETPAVKSTPNTNSSKKSSQRGRPKGSKNKPKPLPADFLEPLQGEDGVSTRAQRTWLLGKQLGLKPRGSEALMLRGLEAQIRQNHPHLN